MSKSRNKNHNEVEYLKGRVKELEKENKSLKQKLKRLEKREHLVEDISQDEEIMTDSEDTYRQLPKLTKCDDCFKGVFEEFEIMDKIIGTCNICGHRKRLK